jgi:hypothetical protein
MFDIAARCHYNVERLVNVELEKKGHRENVNQIASPCLLLRAQKGFETAK